MDSNSLTLADLISPAEAAKIIGVSLARVRQLRDSGALQAVETSPGRYLFVRKSAISRAKAKKMGKLPQRGPSRKSLSA